MDDFLKFDKENEENERSHENANGVHDNIIDRRKDKDHPDSSQIKEKGINNFLMQLNDSLNNTDKPGVNKNNQEK